MRWALIVIWLAGPVWAETTICKGTDVTVSTPTLVSADLACEAVKQAEILFSRCDLPSLTDPLKIEIVSDLKPACVAVYHCGTDRIEILELSSMEARRSSKSDFSSLSAEDYFQSVVVHELSHVLFDDTPCPFASCPATNEYFAYVMQVMSLTPSERTAFAENAALEKRISRDELNLMILLMAPDRFAQKAWAHVLQQENPCAFVRQVLDGKVLLDRERF